MPDGPRPSARRSTIMPRISRCAGERNQRDRPALSSDPGAAVEAGLDADGSRVTALAQRATGGLKASSVNRHCKSLKAALNLAAAHDDRITNAKAWTIGLAAIPEDDDTESNLVLSDEQRRAVIASAYAISPEFGLYVEVHAATGARAPDRVLDVGDLHAGKEPKLMMPSSLKGRNRRTRTRKPIPITPSLAKRLKPPPPDAMQTSRCC